MGGVGILGPGLQRLVCPLALPVLHWRCTPFVSGGYTIAWTGPLLNGTLCTVLLLTPTPEFSTALVLM